MAVAPVGVLQGPCVWSGAGALTLAGPWSSTRLGLSQRPDGPGRPPLGLRRPTRQPADLAGQVVLFPSVHRKERDAIGRVLLGVPTFALCPDQMLLCCPEAGLGVH